MRGRLVVGLSLLTVGLLFPVACGTAPDDSPAPDNPQAEDSDGDPTNEDSEAGDATSGDGLRVAFIHDGAVDDGGWTTAHDAGRQYLEDNLPGVEVTTIENAPAGDQARAAFQDLAHQGYDLIIGTTFYQDDALAVAEDFPDVKFLTWGGFVLADNLGHFELALEDGRYLDGMVAGSMSETGAIGYPAAFPIEQIVRGANAFTRGVREINPEARVITAWTLSWFDPPKEREVAESLLDAGVDVLGMGFSSPAAASVAQRRGVDHIGYGWDQSARAPDTWLTSFTFDWGPYYLAQAQAVLDGTWTAEIFYGGLADGMIGRAPFGEDVPQDVIELVEERTQEIRDGSFDVLAGPIHDNEGNLVVAEGETVPFQERSGCCDWLIEGIDGSLDG